MKFKLFFKKLLALILCSQALLHSIPTTGLEHEVAQLLNLPAITLQELKGG